MKNARVFEMLYLLLERPKITVRELAERLEVSERTVRRDVDSLSGAGIPVYMAPGRGGGVRLLPGFTLEKSLLSAQDQEELLCALQLMQSAGLEGKALLSRLSGFFQRESPPDWIEADFTGWGPGGERIPFPLLKKGILNRRVLQFDYYSSSGGGSCRKVEPARLCFKGISWYLQAWCRERADWRIFKLSRMERVCLTDECFIPRTPPPVPKDIELNLPTVPVVIRFASAAAFRVYDEFPRRSITREPDGSLLVRVSWPAGEAGCAYLFSYGAQAELLEPGSMRRRMAEELRRMQEKY